MSTVVYHLVKLYERDSYAEFVRSNLNALLESCGIAVETEQRALRGGARIVVGHTVEDVVNRQPSRGGARQVNGSPAPGTAP